MQFRAIGITRNLLLLALPLWALAPADAVAVMGGAPIPESVHPEVKRVDLAGGGGTCTGTLISPRTLLTAGHCVRDALGGGSLDMSVDGVPAVSYVIDPGYESGADGGLAYDVAVVRLRSSFAYYAALATSPAQEGESVELVGYGLDAPGDDGSVGIKRSGSNRIAQVMWGQIVVQADGSGNGAVPEPGDSGGPLFDPSGRVVGVTSRTLSAGAGESMGSYIDVTSPEIASFISDSVHRLGGWN